MATSSKRKRLLDAFQFPGFRPLKLVRGVFGDPWARVITLVRRSKKPSARNVAGRTLAGTTERPGARDLSSGNTRVYLEFEVRRVLCRCCGKVKRERIDFVADNPFYTKRFA